MYTADGMKQRIKQLLIQNNYQQPQIQTKSTTAKNLSPWFIKNKWYLENQKNGEEFEEDLLNPGSGDNKIKLKLIWSMKISQRRLCLFDSSAKYQKQLEREDFSSWQEY